MLRRIVWGLKALLALTFASTLSLPATAQTTPKPPAWSHAFDLKCRKSTTPKFDKAEKFGVEVFRDDNNGNGLYIIETGGLAAVGGFKDAKLPGNQGRTPAWMHGLDLKVRPAGVESFDKAKVFGLEIFRDENNGNFLAITETGAIGVAPGARGFEADAKSPKAPKWVHGIDLKVRAGGVRVFDRDTKVWSIEVFLDENNGNLIYMCESGAVAIVPGFKDTPAPVKDAKAPAWLHGLDLKVRKGGQKDFDGKTKTFGLEVFRDENYGNVIYITETGSLSVVPGKKDLKVPTPNPSQPAWTHGLDLKCRKFGTKDFGKDTPLFGVEVFNDDNTGCTLYICETGAVTAVAFAAKQ